MSKEQIVVQPRAAKGGGLYLMIGLVALAGAIVYASDRVSSEVGEVRAAVAETSTELVGEVNEANETFREGIEQVEAVKVGADQWSLTQIGKNTQSSFEDAKKEGENSLRDKQLAPDQIAENTQGSIDDTKEKIQKGVADFVRCPLGC